MRTRRLYRGLTMAVFGLLAAAPPPALGLTVIDLPDGSVLRQNALAPDTWHSLWDRVPQSDRPALLNVVRAAQGLRLSSTGLGRFLAEGEWGDCGEASAALLEALSAVVPEGWTARLVRGPSSSGGSAVAYTAVLVTSASGRHYLVDVSQGWLQVALMEQSGGSPPSWRPAAGEELSFSRFAVTPYLGSEVTAGEPQAPEWCPAPLASAAPIGVTAEGAGWGVIGPAGAGSERHVTPGLPLHYTVRFENPSTAAAPVRELVVELALDPAVMDLDAFSLGTLRVGTHELAAPPGAREISADLDLGPGPDAAVRVSAALHAASGTVIWRFTTLDAETGEPSRSGGFLPPNGAAQEGEVSVTCAVTPRDGLPTGTELRARATFTFDGNRPIAGSEWTNTLDAARPTSQVTALAATQPNPSFRVTWSGQDQGSGIRDYSVFVSEDDGPFLPWLLRVQANSGTFEGKPGRRYAFYSLAADHAGNVQATPAAPQAATTVEGGGLAGDVNGDGTLDVRDAILAIRLALRLSPGTPQEVRAADLNGNGQVEVTDVVLLLRRILGLDS